VPKNNMQFWTILSLCFVIGGVVLLAIGIGLNDMDTMWMIFLGFFLFLSFSICTVLFWRQAVRLRRMFEGKNLLAHWVYSKEKAVKHAREEERFRKRAALVLWLTILAFVVVFSLLFVLLGDMDTEESIFFLAIMGAVLGVTGLAALTGPRYSARKISRSLPEAFVGETASWVMGEYDCWKSGLTQLKSVDIQPWKADEATFPVKGAAWQIEIVYRQLQRFGYQERTVHIPIPVGDEEKARGVVEQIARVNGLAKRER